MIGRLPKNPKDARCWEVLLAKNLLPSTRGFPTFVAWTRDKKDAAFVFVKRGRRIKPRQEKMAIVLAEAGLPVFVFNGSGLDKFEPPHKKEHAT